MSKKYDIKTDKFIFAHGELCEGEAGKTGGWRSYRPIINHERCTPSRNKKPSCFLCWLYCPEGVVKRSIPVFINYDYCKGCGICASECPTKAIEMIEEATFYQSEEGQSEGEESRQKRAVNIPR